MKDNKSEKKLGFDPDFRGNISERKDDRKIEVIEKEIERSKLMLGLSLEVDPGDVHFSKIRKFISPSSKFDSEGRFAQGQELNYYYCDIKGEKHSVPLDDYPPPSVYEKARSNKSREDAEKTLVWEWYIDKNFTNLDKAVTEIKEKLVSLPDSKKLQDLLSQTETFAEESRKRWQARQEEIKPVQLFSEINSVVESLKKAGIDLTNRVRNFRYRPKQLGNSPGNMEDFVNRIAVLEDFQEKISDIGEYIADPALRTEARRRLRALKEDSAFIEKQYYYVGKWEDLLTADSEVQKSTGVFFHFEGNFDNMYGAKNDTFVIDAGGNHREHDQIKFTGKTRKGAADPVGKKIWDRIEPEELAVEVIKKGDIPELLVHKRPRNSVTEEQRVFIKNLEVEYGVPSGTFGFDEEINIERAGKKELVAKKISEFLELRNVPQNYRKEIQKFLVERQLRIEDFLDQEGVVVASEDDLERWAWSLGQGSDYDSFPRGVYNALFSTNRARDLGRIFHAGSVNPNPCLLIDEISLEDEKLQFIVNKYRGKQNLHARIVKF